jgi:Ca-activated chloride channel family protein
MTFATPLLLWLLLLPAALLAWEIARVRRSSQNGHPKILRGRAGARDFELLAGQSQRFGRARARVWLCLGLALAVVALARPQYGLLEEQVFDQSREIMIAVDLSKSMLAEDVKPSRLGRAKLLIQSLLERLEGERVGLVLFSGTAFVQSPLSSDYEILNEFLPVLDPGYLPAGGTNYEALLRASAESFGPAGTADRFLIVLSDGEATDEKWRDELPALKEKGIRVIGLGVGTAGGSMIPDGSGGFIKDERGAVVMSKLENATLQELAKETNGTYEDASTWVDIARLMQGTVEAGQQGSFKKETRARLNERFQWALAPALLCLLISYWREFPARPKPRELRLVAPKSTPARSPAASVAVLLAAALVLAGARPALRAATLDPRQAATATPPAASAAPATGEPAAEPSKENIAQVAAAPLAKAVDRISRQARRAAADWAELARLTVNYGEQLANAKEKVPEAPIRDALQAVDLGSALDAKAADWPTLRRQLEELLKNPDEPPKEEPPPPPPEDQNKQDDQKKNDPDENKSDAGAQPQEKSDQNAEPKDQPPDQDQKDQQKQPPPDQQKKDQADSAFGDMNDEEPPQDQNPADQSPPKNETQKVGGATKDQPRNENPSLTVPLQHLDELRDRDNPADLFQLMDDQPPPKPTGKDW